MNHITLKQLDPKLKDAVLLQSIEMCQSINNQQIEVNKAIQELTQRKEIYNNFCKKYDLKLSCDVEHDMVIEAICDLFSISREKLMAKTRKKEIVVIRQSLTYTLHYMFGGTTSLKTIGEWVGAKDHSTVIHSKKCVQHAILKPNSYPLMLETYEKIKEFLKNEFYVIID
jgi:chromosomal replication initiation ATPase DnaA